MKWRIRFHNLTFLNVEFYASFFTFIFHKFIKRLFSFSSLAAMRVVSSAYLRFEAFALIHYVLQDQTCLLFQVSFDFYFCIPAPIMKRTSFWVLVPEGRVGLHRTVQLLQLQLTDWGIDLENWYLMVFFENKSSPFCCFWDFNQVLHFGLYFDNEGYSISSKGFLPMVVDIMVIWIKFTHGSPF